MSAKVRRPASWLRVAVLLFFALSVERSALGACSEIHPDSHVALRLAKAEYAACTLDSMGKDYAEILSDQAQLLGLLRPVYERQLKKEFDAQQVRVRLKEFDTMNVNPKETKLAEALTAASSDSKKGVPAKGESHQTQKLLKEIGAQRESLRSRIAKVKDGLDKDDSSAYCKLDFYFRLGEGLNGKMRKCLK